MAFRRLLRMPSSIALVRRVHILALRAALPRLPRGKRQSEELPTVSGPPVLPTAALRAPPLHCAATHGGRVDPFLARTVAPTSAKKQTRAPPGDTPATPDDAATPVVRVYRHTVLSFGGWTLGSTQGRVTSAVCTTRGGVAAPAPAPTGTPVLHNKPPMQQAHCTCVVLRNQPPNQEQHRTT